MEEEDEAANYAQPAQNSAAAATSKKGTEKNDEGNNKVDFKTRAMKSELVGGEAVVDIKPKAQTKTKAGLMMTSSNGRQVKD